MDRSATLIGMFVSWSLFSFFQYEEIPGTLEHINELMVEKEVRLVDW
jgi:hypothetical protein